MPGIVGLISEKTEDSIFRAMQGAMNHRNYILDTLTEEGLHLSRIHLNKINPLKQPLRSNEYTLILHGEIFAIDNKRPATGQDSASFFLDTLQKNGFGILKKINGQFCAAVYNNRTGLTSLIADRFGTFPLYYSVDKQKLLFASEVKAILKGTHSRQINDHSLIELFTFGHLFGEKTMFQNISLLPAGTILHYDKSSVSVSRYWSYPYSEATYSSGSVDRKTEKDLEEKLLYTMTSAAERQSADVDNMLLSLSGGLDSRYVAALYHRIGVRKLPTFTIGPDENEDQKYATMVADELGWPHYKFDIKPKRIWSDAQTFSYVADGMSLISGPLQNFEPLEHFSQQQKIVTYSQMCDALFGSTLNRTKVKIFKLNEAPRNVINEALVNHFKRYDDLTLKLLLQPHVYRKMKDLFRIVPEKYCNDHYHPLHNYFEIFMNEYVRRGVLGGNIIFNLFYHTRMISFDNEVFDFGWKLPIAYREHQYLYRKTFGRFFPELAKIKRQGYNLRIDASNFAYKIKVLEKKIAAVALKSPMRHVAKYYKPWNTPGYVNFNKWFRQELREDLSNLLVRQPLKSSEVINPQYVKTLVAEHLDGKRDHSAILWQIINVEYFYRNFID